MAQRQVFGDAEVFRRHKNFGKKVSVVAIDFVQESSKSQLSSRFLSRSKFWKFARHFLENAADRPRIYANLITSCTNPGTIGWIRQKMACEIFELRTAQKSWGELRFWRFLDQNDRNDPIFFFENFHAVQKQSRRPKNSHLRRRRRRRRRLRRRRRSFTPMLGYQIERILIRN